MTKTAPTRLAVISTLAACALLGATGARADTCTANPSGCEPFVVTINQIGSDVVATGSGEFDLTGLTHVGNFSIAPLMFPASAVLALGTDDSQVQTYIGFSGPTAFGSAIGGGASSSIGSGVILNRQIGFLGVPFFPGNNGIDISTQDIFANTTLAAFGLTPGTTFVWTWGTAADQSFTIDIGPVAATPLPAALPLFATGLGALGLLGWRRKRKAQAAA